MKCGSALTAVAYFESQKQRCSDLTFDGTAGGLRSDHVYAIFVDREGVIWFGTDRGVCRYDPHAPRVEPVGDNSDTNFIRSLYQASNGRTLAGTNRGLYVYDEETSSWNSVTALGRNVIYAIAEDKSQRLLVASAERFLRRSKAIGAHWKDKPSRASKRARARRRHGSVRAITQFRGATYFAIFGRGIDRIEGGRTSLTWPNYRR